MAGAQPNSWASRRAKCWLITALQDQRRIKNWRAGIYSTAAAVKSDVYASRFTRFRINYYPPRGDNKESGTISIFLLLNDPLSDQSGLFCAPRLSILAAPIVLETWFLFLDLAASRWQRGIQELAQLFIQVSDD